MPQGFDWFIDAPARVSKRASADPGELLTHAETPRPLDHAPPLWVRIALAGMAITLVVVIFSGLYLQSVFGESSRRALEKGVQDHLELLAPAVRSALARDDVADLQRIALAGKKIEALRVTVILPDGSVVAESERRLPIASHADRPEFIAAMRDGHGQHERRSTTVGEPYRYVARRLDDDAQRPLGVLRLALPARAVEANQKEALTALLLAALFSLPIALALAWLLARRIARPLEEMTDAAQRMASGDFAQLPRGLRDDEEGRLAEALGKMGQAISQMLAAGESERLHLESILTSMAEGVLAIDLDGRVLRINLSAVESLGLHSRPAAGTPLEEFLRVPPIVTALREGLQGVATAAQDVRLPGTAGHVLSVGAVPMTTSEGDVLGAVMVLRDVTVIRRLEGMRLDFVANVSHELRTPLAAVSSAIETIVDLGEDEPEMRARLLETAGRHGHRLGAIVDDLLSLSRIESEGDLLERVPVDLLRTIRAAAGTAVNEAHRRTVTLELPTPDADPIRVIGHEGRLEQVWINLLTNAMKYNRDGGSVRVSAEAQTERGMAVVRISDTGPGIPAEHLPRIFERFYRVDKSRSRDQGGTGLGLAIVKHIVRTHRGHVEVTSTSGEGTVFEIQLPLAPC